jgi:hypothetical protein
MDLDGRRAQTRGGLDLAPLRRNEQRHVSAGVDQLSDDRRQHVMLCHDVESALGRPLGALFRDDTGGIGFGLQRDRHHLGRRRHFEVERAIELGHEARNIVVGNVTPVFAQMRSDVVGARLERELGRAHGIGMHTTACIPQGGDMIDVDAQSDRRNGHWASTGERSSRRRCWYAFTVGLTRR